MSHWSNASTLPIARPLWLGEQKISHLTGLEIKWRSLYNEYEKDMALRKIKTSKIVTPQLKKTIFLKPFWNTY